jgi:hypothetical protein
MNTLLRYCWIIVILLIFVSCEDSADDTSPTSSESSAYALSDGAGGGPSPGGTDGNIPPRAGQITAGEWRDLNEWDFWIGLQENDDWQASRTTWGLSTDYRYPVQVVDRSNLPVVDALATLYDQEGTVLWQSRTDAQGVAELWASDPAASVAVEYQGQTTRSSDVLPFSQGKMTLTLPISRSCPDQIDLLFAVDATGSMGDELEYLKSELTDVIARIEPTAGVRLSTVFYRDQGDEYVVRSFPFTSESSQMIENIRNQSADGGGDTPEAVHSALEEAITQMNWSERATARLLFLLLDAPPHQDDQVKQQLQTLIPLASRKGIRIIPISASGIDKPTEFLLRSMAILTQGTYVFVTDDSGIGNDHLEPTVGEYEVELLNDLLVRLINAYGARCGTQL